MVFTRFCTNHITLPALLLLLLLATGVLRAQPVHSVLAGLGVLSSADRDRGFSPLVYSGVAWGGRLSYQRKTTRRSDEVILSVYSGRLLNKYKAEMTTRTGRLYTYTWYYPDSEDAPVLVWGWSNQNTLFMRQHNTFSNFSDRFNYLTTWGPAAKAVYHFSIRDRIHMDLSARTYMQWLGFGFHSSYVNSSLRGYEDGKAGLAGILLRSVELFYPLVHWHMGISPALDVQLKSHRIRLMYSYQYLRLRNAHEFTGSRGEWSLSFITIL